MLFNSVAFALFLPIVFGLYWLIGSGRRKGQNLLLILASFLFYGWWDYRFVLLLLASTCFDFYVGYQLGRISAESKRKLFFRASILANLGVLCFFKYFNFFSENFSLLLHSLGLRQDALLLHVILPIGISFYTFHSMSYVIDVYHRRKEPCHDALSYFAFISFFPLLIAGPIVRATWFLPQFQSERQFEPTRAADGLRQMLWGFFKKMVIADGCAQFVNPIFDTWNSQPGAMLVAGAVLFAFQIYGDFSGYSDIAIGCARLFGFHIPPNFRFPYFSRDIAEFWRRWHISLTTWFRDYVYIPMGGNRSGPVRKVWNILIVFLLSGFWHGASWTYIIWALIHVILFLPLLLTHSNRNHLQFSAHNRLFPSFLNLALMLFNFALVSLAWIFFRAPDSSTAFHYLSRIFSSPWGSLAVERRIWFFIGLMLLFEWFHRNREHGLELQNIQIPLWRWAIYVALLLIIFFFGAPPQTFIYFQF
ncbi:MAG: MBOAT family protein [Bacteroidetes bacterium]|nr:MBOAT family protein [Bacteroidota bacterium]